MAGAPWTAHWLYWVAPTVGIEAGMHLYEALRGCGAPAVPTDVLTGTEEVVQPATANLPSGARGG